MKKQKFVYALLAVVLTMAMLLGACRTAAPAATQAPAAEPTKAAAAQPVVVADDFKIGILTGTVSQGEEEFNEAQNQKAAYGDMIVHNTYPDNFSSETETTISQAVALASDPKVKAIVWVQGVPGTAPAIDKIREIRQDIAIIVGVPAENPDVISGKADIVMAVDEISMGKTIPAEAARMGAKVFIHYSFPRHMGYATIAARHAIMVEECAKLGIEFVDVTAPDPTGDAGISGAQQFITEDVKREIEKYGKDTAFFSTNCGMQEPLIREVWKNGGIFPQQCCPSPYHGYPSALGIDVKGHEGDVQYMLDQIQAKLVENNQQARMSTWGVPINMLMIDAGVRYGIKYAKGEVSANDLEAFNATIQEAAAAREVGNLDIGFYTENGVDYKNYLLLLAPFYNFAADAAAAPAAVVAETPKFNTDFKVGILTGTVSQGEEEFNEAQNQVKAYGDAIVHNTYPDNFSSETETTISQAVALASDPKVKAIVWVQGVPGTAPAIDKIREIRQDIAIIVGVPAENPDVISGKADIVMAVDEISMGKTIPAEAARMGAKVFIHYSFPRHMGYATIAARHAIMVEECAKLGIEFVDVTAPDPTGDAGISGAQQFITEDVKRQIEKYGKDTAFFSTNCGMQEPLIREVWKNGGIFPQQCCPSPYHGYPSALGIDVKGHEGDVQYMLDQIQAKLVENNQQARMSTWGVPINMLMIDAGVRYGIKYGNGEVSANDLEAFNATIQEAAAAREVGNLDLSFYTENGVDYENYLLLLAPFYNFAK